MHGAPGRGEHVRGNSRGARINRDNRGRESKPTAVVALTVSRTSETRPRRRCHVDSRRVSSRPDVMRGRWSSRDVGREISGEEGETKTESLTLASSFSPRGRNPRQGGNPTNELSAFRRAALRSIASGEGGARLEYVPGRVVYYRDRRKVHELSRIRSVELNSNFRSLPRRESPRREGRFRRR